MNKFFKHFIKVCKHKHYVRQYCWKVGLYKQGICHDLSKFSPVEFIESVKYYQGDRSPIDACKEENGYSNAWLHHKGRNPHHYEYWQDNFDKGGEALKMPFKYAAEMLCDYLGAGKAYMGKDFDYVKEYKWWIKKNQNPIAMHNDTWCFIDIVLEALSRRNGDEDAINAYLTKENLKKVYILTNEEA